MGRRSNLSSVKEANQLKEILQFIMDRFQTPIGEMVIVADHKGNLCAADWTDHDPRIQRVLRLHYGERGYELTPGKNPHGLSEKIQRYFAGELAILDTAVSSHR
jgi:methylated-DNA-[protein]-cysteine S-methyltransferase